MGFSDSDLKRALVALGATIALSLGPSCVFESAGIEVPLRVVVREGASGEGLALRRFDLSVTGVELVSCGPDAALAPSMIRVRVVRALGPSVAHAHERGTPLSVTGGAVLDLAARDASTPTELGRFTPPPGAYCSVRVVLAPSDEHSLGVDRDPEGLLRTTLRAEGTEPATGEPFAMRTAARTTVERTLAEPLRLSDPTQSAVVELTVDAAVARSVVARSVTDAGPALADFAEAFTVRALAR